jgi:Recombination directionality factor-like
MPIVGLTHNSDGSAVLRRSVTTKIAIGLPPKDKSDHPQRLDHFIFQKKGQRGSGMSAEVLWEIDQDKSEHYGKGCREVEIILLDNVPDRVFRTEYAWWTATQKQCWGDGETATRRTPRNPRGESWEPCANDDCLDLLEERCRPSGDLYFLLADYPTLGTICKLHTSSYQSIREIYAALEDIRNHTNGRLIGLRVKLFVRPEKNAYKDDQGNRRSGTKHVLGLELAANDVKQLASQTLATPEASEAVDRQLAGHEIEIDDPEEEQASTLKAEFYPATDIKPAPSPAAFSEGSKDNRDEGQRTLLALKERIESAFSDLRLNTAQRVGLLDQYQSDLPALLERLTRAREKRSTSHTGPTDASPVAPPAKTNPNGRSHAGGNAVATRTEHTRRER